LRPHDHPGWKDTYLVGRLRIAKRRRRRVRVGAPDPALTGLSGMVAVTELCEHWTWSGRWMPRWDRSTSELAGTRRGNCWLGWLRRSWRGEDHLVGLDRQRADVAGQALMPIAGLCSTTAGGLARRITRAQGADLEAGLATVSAGILSRLPAARREALLAVATIDLDTTDVEAYGRRKQVEACNYQGNAAAARMSRPGLSSGVALGADLLAGNEDPRRGAPGLLRRALAALPEGVGQVQLRADGGYFAVDLAIAAYRAGVGFAIGAKRIAPLWRTLV
jgi:hypothetical protein